jgi:hypothetical protein
MRLILLLGLLALSNYPLSAQPRYLIDSQSVWWSNETIFSLDTGELQPDHLGCEIALLDSTGSVYLITPQAPFWSSRCIINDYDPPAYMAARPTVAVGDLIADAQGEEVVAMASMHLNIASRNEDEVWQYETIFSSEGMTGHPWGARAGDYLPSLPGDELMLIQETVYDFAVGHLGYRLDDKWRLDVIYNGEVGMDSAAGEFDSGHDGTEIIIPTEMGPFYQLIETGSPPYDCWSRVMVLHDFSHAGWVSIIADVEPEFPGDEIIFGTRYTNSILIDHVTESIHNLELIFTGEAEAPVLNMWDIATGDILPTVGKDEIIGVDNTGRVYLLWRDANGWGSETLWIDPGGPLYAVVVADFDQSHPGEEILVGGVSGTLTLLTVSEAAAVTDNVHPIGSIITAFSSSPNPFRQSSIIHLELIKPSLITCEIYTTDGGLIRRLIDAELVTDSISMEWDGRDRFNQLASSGVYCLRVVSAQESFTRPLILIR